MTCIVGLVENGVVHLGGDSAGVGGMSLTHRADPKVFTVGEFAIGFTTSFRMGQLLRFSFTPPAIAEGEDLERYMVTRFVDAIRECFKTGGFATKSNDREEGGTFLVGVRGRLFRICEDYQVGEPIDGYDACGCGDDLAKGALFASSSQPAVSRLKVALSAAARWSAGVREPFRFVSTTLVANSLVPNRHEDALVHPREFVPG